MSKLIIDAQTVVHVKTEKNNHGLGKLKGISNMIEGSILTGEKDFNNVTNI